MNPSLSDNTQAILLLTAPLIVGRGQPSANLLSPGEYKRLARHLHQLSRAPADLLSAQAEDLVREVHETIDAARLKGLLARGLSLSQAMDRWQTRSIWVVSRADADYPRLLRERLKEDRPPVIYGCGERSILESGGLAVVGSRNVDDALIEYTESVGRLTGKAHRTLVSGAARGIDQAAMRGALEAGGRVIGVMADSLEKAAVSREHRELLMDEKLVLISPYDPGAGFNVGNAMQRNKLIYALSDAALVVNADQGKGGTWTGAVEQLEKLRFVPVFVRTGGAENVALTALRKKGAHAWPDPRDVDELNNLLDKVPALEQVDVESSQLTLADAVEDASSGAAQIPAPTVVQDGLVSANEAVAPLAISSSATVPTPVAKTERQPKSPADQLFEAARGCIVQVLIKPKKVTEIAAELQIAQSQLKEWLKLLVDAGVLVKAKGSLYQVAKAEPIDLFSIADPADTSSTKT